MHPVKQLIVLELNRFFLYFASVLFAGAANAGTPPAEAPFWKTKPKVYRRITDHNEIIVAVKTAPTADPKAPHNLVMAGGGRIAVPLDFAFQRATDFPSLVKMSDHIKEIKIIDPGKEIYIHTAAFGYHAKMWLKIKLHSDSSHAAIDFNVVKGEMTGMAGTISFDKKALEKTEIGIQSHYAFSELPIPRFFAEFGLEVVLQKMAGRIRSYLQSQYERMKISRNKGLQI